MEIKVEKYHLTLNSKELEDMSFFMLKGFKNYIYQISSYEILVEFLNKDEIIEFKANLKKILLMLGRSWEVDDLERFILEKVEFFKK